MEDYRCHVCGYETDNGADLEEHLTWPFLPRRAAKTHLGIPPEAPASSTSVALTVASAGTD